MNKLDSSLQHLIPHNMTVNFYMLHSFMEYRIRTYVESYLAVTKQQCFSIMIDLKILNKLRIQTISQVEIVIVLYSASAEDLEIVDCFFDFHETSESPMNIQYPVTDLLVSGHETQSKSVKPLLRTKISQENPFHEK